jgi:Cupin superfamily protein
MPEMEITSDSELRSPQDRLVLEQLIGSAETFMACHWGSKEYFCASGDRAPGMQLPSATEILEMLDGVSLDPADVRLTSPEIGPISSHLWTETPVMGTYVGSRTIRPAEVAKRAREGSSVVIHDFQRYSASVRRTCESLAAKLRTPARAVVFVTPPEKAGLKVHLDPWEIFAVQITGIKEWVVYPQQRPVSQLGKTFSEVPAGAAGKTFALHPGDCLYVPAGSPHATRALTDGISIHISFGIEPLYWRQIIDHLISEALKDSRFEGAVPAGWPGEFPLHAELQQRLHVLSDQLGAVADADSIDRFLEARWRGTIHGAEFTGLAETWAGIADGRDDEADPNSGASPSTRL